MTINIPIVNKLSLNKIYGGVHYRTRKKHKDEYLDTVWKCQPPMYEGDYPVEITYHFKFKGKRLDSTNCGYLAKLLEDALVKCGVMPDDSPKYVYSSKYISDKGENDVDIIIKPLCQSSN